jgi:hypothetical protein
MNKVKKTIIFTFLTFYFHILLFSNPGDTLKRPTIVGFKSHYGFIIPHSKVIENNSGSNPFGAEIILSKFNVNENDWRQCNCYSRIGISFGAFNFGNKAILGNSTNLQVFIEPVIKPKNNLFFTFKAGTGIAYLSEIYNEIYNPENLFFSTHISFLLYIDFLLHYKITNNLVFNMGANYNHISNGGTKQPNKGMNFPTASIGLEYIFNPVDIKLHNYTKKDTVSKKIKNEFIFFYSLKMQAKSSEFKETPCNIIGGSWRIVKRISTLNAFSIGTDLVWDGFIKEQIRREQTEIDNKRVSITVGHDLLFGRFLFSTQIGFYIYSPYKAMDPVYEKYALFYKINKNFISGIFLKAHRHVAELMGISAGYAF